MSSRVASLLAVVEMSCIFSLCLKICQVSESVSYELLRKHNFLEVLSLALKENRKWRKINQSRMTS